MLFAYIFLLLTTEIRFWFLSGKWFVGKPLVAPVNFRAKVNYFCGFIKCMWSLKLRSKISYKTTMILKLHNTTMFQI